MSRDKAGPTPQRPKRPIWINRRRKPLPLDLSAAERIPKVLRLLALPVAGSVVFAELVPQYFLDPKMIPKPWIDIVGWLGFLTIFSATAALAFLGYVFIVGFVSDTINKIATEFEKAIGVSAAVGATLGTLLGLRLAAPLMNPGPFVDSPPRPTFVEYIGFISNMATVLTLFMVAICWGLALRLVVAVFKTDKSKFRSRTGFWSWLLRSPSLYLVIISLVIWINVAIPAGYAVQEMILKR
jgi:hypothetical protein